VNTRRNTEVTKGLQGQVYIGSFTAVWKLERCRKVDPAELSLFPFGPFLAERNCIAPLRKNK
jgi:hypothetical protein